MKTQLMEGWSGGWKPAVDQRPDMEENEEYDDWMDRVGYEHTQTMGNPDGYHAEIWVKLKEGGYEAAWIVVLSDGNTTSDIKVEGLLNLADLMSHLGAGFTASCLDGLELSQMWNDRSEFRKQREKAQEVMMNAIKQHEDPCDCSACITGREKAKAERAAGMN